MGKIYDISNQIDDEATKIKIKEGLELELNEDFKVILKIVAMAEGGLETAEEIENFLKLAFGEEGYAKIEASHIKFKYFVLLVKTVMAAIKGTSIEEEQADRFQEK